MHQFARGRKNNVSLEEMGKIMENKDLFELAPLVLPPGGVERLGQWEQEYMEKAKQDPDLKFYMCDVDHSVNTKGSPSAKMFDFDCFTAETWTSAWVWGTSLSFNKMTWWGPITWNN